MSADWGRCSACKRIKKDYMQCAPCSAFTCAPCAIKQYYGAETPFNEYFTCSACKALFCQELSSKCARAIRMKIYDIRHQLLNIKKILHTHEPYCYINQLSLSGQSFNEATITKFADNLHESFFSGEPFKKPAFLLKLPVKRRQFKPDTPAVIIELESHRHPVLSGNLEELYEAFSCGTLTERIEKDYKNRKINEKIDRCIADFESGKITETKLWAMASLGGFGAKYNDDGTKVKKTVQAATSVGVSDDEASEAASGAISDEEASEAATEAVGDEAASEAVY